MALDEQTELKAHKYKWMVNSEEIKMKSINASTCDEIVTIEDHVKNSEVLKNMNSSITFDYELRDKAAKTKLVKAAKRTPIEMEENSTSTNLTFSPGSWYNVVQPSIKYWNESQ